MNSIGEMAHRGVVRDPTLQDIFAEVMAGRRARSPLDEAAACLAPARRIFDSPVFEGKCCCECKRQFKSSAQYLICKLCKALVCRRTKGGQSGTCKHVHHGNHRAAFLKAQKTQETA
jgi:hypothetical protein